MAAATERPEAVRAEAAAGAPEVIAGEVDVLPAERRDMGEQGIGNGLAAVAQAVQGAAEVDG